MVNLVFQILDGNFATSKKQTQIHYKFLQKKKINQCFSTAALALEGFSYHWLVETHLKLKLN